MKIKTFLQDGEETKSREKEMKTFTVPSTIPRNTQNKYVCKNRHTHNPYIEKMLIENELAEVKKTDRELKEQTMQDLKHHRVFIRHLKTQVRTIGMFRRLYNRNKLYASQPLTYLLSWSYNESGYIIIGGNNHSMAYFEDCYLQCVNLKIADPRFVSYDYIIEIRNRKNDGIKEWLEWIVPTDTEIKELGTKLGIRKIEHVYNSVAFYPGFSREETPEDFEPANMGN